MKIYDIFKKRKIEFFTIEEAVEYHNKKGVLVLNSSFFILLKISISPDTDPRERELLIEDEICEYIEDYNPFDYIEKEIVLSQGKEEELLITLIEREKIEAIIEELKNSKITLEGIIPMFFLEFYNQEVEAKTYIEIEDERFRLYYFKDKKLHDFQEVEFSAEELVEDPTYLEEYLEEESYVFTYDNNKNEIYSAFYFINFRDWKEYNLFYKEELNFLPAQHIEELKLKKSIQILVGVLAFALVIESSTSLLLNIYIKNSMDNLNTIHRNIERIKDKISDEKEEILEIEKNIALLEEENVKHSFSPIKISEIIENILKSGNGIEITQIEYNGKNRATVTGKTDVEKKFYDFEKRILSHNIFSTLNHDFFTMKNSFYEFKLEIEVKDESAR